jgi:hypothetical protein
MEIVDRINSCHPFAHGYCPHQALMERLYLIYQIFKTERLLKSEARCCDSGNWSSGVPPKSAEPCRLSRGNSRRRQSHHDYLCRSTNLHEKSS